MSPELMQKTAEKAMNTLTSVGLSVLGALVLYLVGRWLITRMISLVQRALEKQKVDPGGAHALGGLFPTAKRPSTTRQNATVLVPKFSDFDSLMRGGPRPESC